MKKKFLIFSSIIMLMVSCHEDVHEMALSSVQNLKQERFVVNRLRLFTQIIGLCRSHSSTQDYALCHYYAQNRQLIWVNDFHSLDRADTLIHFLQLVTSDGLHPRIFHLLRIKRMIRKLRNLDFKKGESITLLIAELDYQLSKDYLCYVDGMKFGFVNPHLLYNNLEDRLPVSPDQPPTGLKRTLYDMQIYRPDKAFHNRALQSIDCGLKDFLVSVQPRDSNYIRLKTELPKALNAQMWNKISLNMERYRWQNKMEKGKKYIWINLAESYLYGVDKITGANIEMKVCQGAMDHKTPELSSHILYAEINPYWRIPNSIVRKDIIPGMWKDPQYLSKRFIKVLDSTGKEVDPYSVHWDPNAKTIPYTFRQDNGGENSLGRIIFRFKNNFSIYLHDTNVHEAFSAIDRKVSHGCIRLERPLDLLWFLMKDKDQQKMDEIKESTTQEEVKRPTYYTFKESAPLFLDYFTVYIDSRGMIKSCKDPYQYDAPLLEALDRL